MPIKIYGLELEPILKLKSEENIDFYIDTQEYHPNSNIKVYIQSEPLTILSNYYKLDLVKYLNNNHSKYNYIFCYDPTSIQAPNVLPKLCAGTWIPKEYYSNIDISKKEFLISNLTGFKLMCKAHLYRRELYINQEKFQEFPIVFFRSSAPPIIPEICPNLNPLIPKDLSAKTILFDSFQYSIVIENTREKNCFSEKIMDCLITKTIPIYYGCENIGDYFDTTGWIILDDTNFLETLYTKLHSLTPTYYTEHLPIVEKNYETALTLADSSIVSFNILSQVLPVTL